VDPTRLLASAERIYGADGVRDRFGLPRPVPAPRVRRLDDGDAIDLGDRRLEILHTPGHAATHIAIQDAATGIVFTGDAVGVHLPGTATVRPAAPPPEFDLEPAVRSIRTIRDRARGSLLLAHFGPASDVEGICVQAEETLRRWTEAVRPVADAPSEEAERVLGDLATRTENALSPDELERYEIIGSVRLNTLGMQRYWRKRNERHHRS
jgi:glyoxylase-like metal-dependent hydrolase (beta-lactamase superfamily II)